MGLIGLSSHIPEEELPCGILTGKKEKPRKQQCKHTRIEETSSVGNYVHNAWTEFGREVNCNRMFPYVNDGLLVGTRRILWQVLEHSPEKFTKSATRVGYTIMYHVHGDASIYDSMSYLARIGILEGQGNFGFHPIMGDAMPASAMRYTEARMSQKYLNIFKEFLDYVPWKEAEVEGEEPAELATPIPMALILGMKVGLGHGIRSTIPSFSVKSLYEALKNNDPQLLESGIGLEIDKGKSDLNKLWTKGQGTITYHFKVYKGNENGDDGVFIEGNSELFQPNWKVFDSDVEAGYLYITDCTDETGTRAFIARNKNIRKITDEEIYQKALIAAEHKENYQLAVTDGNTSFYIPMYEWLKISYKNYLNTIKKYKEDKLNKARFALEVWNALPIVAGYWSKNRKATDEETVKATKIRLEVIQAIKSKSIGTLQCSEDQQKIKIKQLEEEIKKFEDLDPVKFTRDIIKKF